MNFERLIDQDEECQFHLVPDKFSILCSPFQHMASLFSVETCESFSET